MINECDTSFFYLHAVEGEIVVVPKQGSPLVQQKKQSEPQTPAPGRRLWMQLNNRLVTQSHYYYFASEAVKHDRCAVHHVEGEWIQIFVLSL